MKIEVITSSGTFRDKYDDRNFLIIKVDGAEGINMLDGEPEDANLSRDFNCAYAIPELMRQAHEAGLRGEPLEIDEEESDDFV